MSIYIVDPKIYTYTFNFMKKYGLFFYVVPKRLTYNKLMNQNIEQDDEYIDTANEVARAVLDMLENLKECSSLKYEIPGGLTSSGQSRVIEIPSRYVTVYNYRKYDDADMHEFENVVLMGEKIKHI